jgi:hypothetical protein
MGGYRFSICSMIEKTHRKSWYSRPSVTIATTNRLTLFREMIAVYCENHTEHTDTLRGQMQRMLNRDIDKSKIVLQQAYLLGFNVVYSVESQPTFRRNM